MLGMNEMERDNMGIINGWDRKKDFTSQNGRTIHSSTGIGLYLCRRLCDKLGIGLSASSAGSGGTTITLAFHINDFITGVQS